VRAREHGFAAEEAVVAVVADFEEAAGEDVAARFGLCLEEAEDEVRLAEDAGVVEAHLGADFDELFARLLFELGDVERSHLALAFALGALWAFSPFGALAAIALAISPAALARFAGITPFGAIAGAPLAFFARLRLFAFFLRLARFAAELALATGQGRLIV
jgi:hypothetical protein